MEAALKALDKHQINSKLVCDCHQTLMELAKQNRVQLIWVPGHEGIAGNETADQLAKIL
jgi:ribonuclease HI